MSNVRAAIKRNWFPPNPGFGLAVTIGVKISQDGRLVTAHVLKSSGNRRADLAAMHAVTSAFPIKPEPKYLNLKRNNLDLIIAFDWMKLTGGVSVTSQEVGN